MGKTIIGFLLDRTGSMESIKTETIEGFNTYIKGLQEGDDGSIYFSLTQFDSVGIDSTYRKKPVKEVPLLTTENYNPHAWTPLIEAACRFIKEIEKEAEDFASKVIICIQTDGQENRSGPEYTWDRLNKLIKEKIEGGWQFNFLGANLDAYVQAGLMGIPVWSTMAYNASSMEATRDAYSYNAASHLAFAKGLATNCTYSEDTKVRAGDSYFQKYSDRKSCTGNQDKQDADN
jgi:hypothetical protein